MGLPSFLRTFVVVTIASPLVLHADHLTLSGCSCWRDKYRVWLGLFCMTLWPGRIFPERSGGCPLCEVTRTHPLWTPVSHLWNKFSSAFGCRTFGCLPMALWFVVLIIASMLSVCVCVCFGGTRRHTGGGTPEMVELSSPSTWC